ncbi:ATP-binding protein, partial [bacterium]|nr:ATP-binding protein [bacterium]
MTTLNPSSSPRKIYGNAKPEELKQKHIDGFSDERQIILILGEGGTGKTRRLRDLQTLLGKDNDRIVAPLYDFYHIENFKASSIEQAIIGVLRKRGADDSNFEAYNAAEKALEAARDDTSVQFPEKQQAVRNAFVSDYNAFAAAQPKHIVLIFDTVEQSVPLTDEAEEKLVQPQTDASAGGYYWLTNTLPQLKNTITVLGGRENVLYGKPVKSGLYTELRTQVACKEFRVTGLNQADTREIAQELRRNDEALDDEEHRVLYLVSDGNPFWIDVFLTHSEWGVEPNTKLDALPEQVSQLSEQERNPYRQAVIESLLDQIGPDTSNPLLIALQCMASLRKGVNKKMLAHVAQ